VGVFFFLFCSLVLHLVRCGSAPSPDPIVPSFQRRKAGVFLPALCLSLIITSRVSPSLGHSGALPLSRVLLPPFPHRPVFLSPFFFWWLFFVPHNVFFSFVRRCGTFLAFPWLFQGSLLGSVASLVNLS